MICRTVEVQPEFYIGGRGYEFENIEKLIFDHG